MHAGGEPLESVYSFLLQAVAAGEPRRCMTFHKLTHKPLCQRGDCAGIMDVSYHARKVREVVLRNLLIPLRLKAEVAGSLWCSMCLSKQHLLPSLPAEGPCQYILPSVIMISGIFMRCRASVCSPLLARGCSSTRSEGPHVSSQRGPIAPYAS